MPKIPPKPRKRGRPTLYRTKFSTQIVEWARKGVCQADMARGLAVCSGAFRQWAKKHPEFAQALGQVKAIESSRRSSPTSSEKRANDFSQLAMRVSALETAVGRLEMANAVRSGRQAVIDALAALDAEDETDVGGDDYEHEVIEIYGKNPELLEC